MLSANLKNDLSTDGNKTRADTRDSLNDAAHKVGHEAREVYDAATAKLTEAGVCITKEIRTNPMRSSAIALGIGVVLGALLRR